MKRSIERSKVKTKGGTRRVNNINPSQSK